MFLFYLLGVGLPCRLIFCQFWLCEEAQCVYLRCHLGSLSYFLLFKDFIYLLSERGEGSEKERERSINVWLPFTHPQLGTQPATMACALTGNQTSYPSVFRLVLNPLRHTSQGPF